MRFLRRSLVGIFLLALTVALLAWAGNTVRGAVVARMNEEPPSFPQRERVFAVNVLTVTPQTVAPELRVFGELRSARTLELRSVVGGAVVDAAANFVEGGAVTAGQVLLKVDPAAVEADKDRAVADLADAEAGLRDAERGVGLAEDELAAAEAQVVLRQQALTRARDLQSRGVGTPAAVEEAELAASAAETTVLTRRQAVATAISRLDQSRTQVSRAQINLAEAERLLADAEVTALFDGVLADVAVAPGGRVTANERIATLIDPSQLEVAFRVSTSQYARLLDADGRLLEAPVTVTLDASGVDLHATGTIIREGAAVGEGQTGRLLFARLDRTAGFRAGDFVTVSIIEPPLDDVAVVPATAVGADNAVLVVGEDDRLVRVDTTILRRQEDDVIIPAGDLAGRQIVAQRSPLLGAGISVRPIDPAAEAAAPEEPEMITLDDARRAKLIAFVTDSPMPDDVKARIMAQLEQPTVSSETIARLEDRMGS